MKTTLYRILIVIGVALGFSSQTYAYITFPSTSYNLEVGVDKYLAVPDAYDGYIDHAVWACSKSEISFKEKDAAGAIIQITRAFSGTAIIELLATEKYVDNFGYTRARTYYKQYLISCSGGGGSGSGTDSNEIILPENITLTVGDVKQFKVISGTSYNGAFSISWKKYSKQGFVGISRDVFAGTIEISAGMAGEGILIVKTANGEEKECSIVVTLPEIVTNRRTEKTAIYDIKSLIAIVLPLSNTSRIEDVFVVPGEKTPIYDLPTNIFNLQGMLLKRNATVDDVKALTPGTYIIGGKKTIIK